MTMTQSAPTAKSFPVNGVDLAWSEQGRGPEGAPALVLCHGFTGSSHDFALEIDALATDRRVVTLDQRDTATRRRRAISRGTPSTSSSPT